MDVDLPVYSISIVWNFLEVFPVELPGLSPLWEVEFSIKLLPETQPILKHAIAWVMLSS